MVMYLTGNNKTLQLLMVVPRAAAILLLPQLNQL
jgi:hypothetical protein